MRCSPLLLLLAACTGPTGETGLPSPATRPDDTGEVPGQAVTVLGYNVESGDAQPATIAANITEIEGEVLWGFSEVQNQAWIETFAEAMNDGDQDPRWVLGSTGGSDRLGIVWDDTVIELLNTRELDAINVGGSARAPFVARMRMRNTGMEFQFMVNHLWRSDASARHEQARLLNEWARDEEGPIIAVGDYNFDWAVQGGEEDHDLGYDRMTADSIWEWARPDELVATQCSFSFDGVLDFTFVAGEAQQWDQTSEVLFPTNVYCQDNAEKPDHRPVLTQFFIPDP